MDPITTRNNLGDDGPEAGVTVHHYMNTGEGLGGYMQLSNCGRGRGDKRDREIWSEVGEADRETEEEGERGR